MLHRLNNLRSSAAVTALLVGAAVVGLSSCAGSQPTARVQGGRNLVLRDLAVCFRAHGLPDFPDPVVGADGVAHFPNSAPLTPVSAQRACSRIADRLPGAARTERAVSSAQFHRLLSLARCIRSRGVPDYPDPNNLGQFSLDANVRGPEKLALVRALRACASLRLGMVRL
jgi:hypothetical protein